MTMLRRLAAVALASFAVLVAHDAAYRVVFTDPHERAHEMHASGHGWWEYAPQLSLVLIVAAFLATVAGAGRRSRRVNRSSFVAVAAGGYVTLELVERIPNADHHGLVEWRTLLIGAVFAAVGGFLASLALPVVEAAVVATVAFLTRAPGPVPVEVHLPSGFFTSGHRVAAVFLISNKRRGPPLLLRR